MAKCTIMVWGKKIQLRPHGKGHTCIIKIANIFNMKKGTVVWTFLGEKMKTKMEQDNDF